MTTVLLSEGESSEASDIPTDHWDRAIPLLAADIGRDCSTAGEGLPSCDLVSTIRDAGYSSKTQEINLIAWTMKARNKLG